MSKYWLEIQPDFYSAYIKTKSKHCQVKGQQA